MDKQKRQQARARALRENLKRRKAARQENEPIDAAPPAPSPPRPEETRG